MSDREKADEMAVRPEIRRLLEAKIDGLPEAFRIVFVLRALEGLSVEATAVALGISEPIVGALFFRE